MKKSNKLLLGGFLTLLLLIAAIHTALYAKYKSGHFTSYAADNDLAPPSLQAYPHILFVTMDNVSDVSVGFNEVAQVEKREEAGLRYVQTGDTLLITGSNDADRQSFGHPLVVNLPYNATLSLLNSSVFFKSGKNLSQTHPVIYLQRSQAVFSGPGTMNQFGQVKIAASDSSVVKIDGRSHINSLDVQLSRSSIEAMEGDIDHLSITTDSASRISLQSKLLLKANIKTIPNE